MNALPDQPEPFGSLDDLQDLAERLERIVSVHGAPALLFVGRPGSDAHFAWTNLWQGGVRSVALAGSGINMILGLQMAAAIAEEDAGGAALDWLGGTDPV